MSLNVKVTKVLPDLPKLVFWLAEVSLKIISGALLVATVTVILPEPILSYWSLKVKLELIVSPEAVPDPLKANPTVMLPEALTANWALEDVNDCTAWLP